MRQILIQKEDIKKRNEENVEPKKTHHKKLGESNKKCLNVLETFFSK